jgi:hypothetical protein
VTVVRRALPLLVAIAGVACGSAMELDVGSNAQTPTPQPDASIAPRTFGTTEPSPIMTRLAKLCAAPAGQPAYYTNASDLSQLLRGRWYRCPNTGAWQDDPPTGLELTFGVTGVYSYLELCEAPPCAKQAPDGFTATTDTNYSGQVLIGALCATSSLDGGAGGEAGTEGGIDDGGPNSSGDANSDCPGYLPINDTTPRNGLYIQMTRSANIDFLFQVTFEMGPRRMELRELTGDPAFAVFVPID